MWRVRGWGGRDGAINAALIAMNAIDELESLWRKIAQFELIRPGRKLAPLVAALAERHDPLPGIVSRAYNVLHGATILCDRGRMFGETGFYDAEPIRRFVFERLDLKRVQTPLAWSGTNLTTALAEAFYVLPQSAPDLASHPADRAAPARRRCRPQRLLRNRPRIGRDPDRLFTSDPSPRGGESGPYADGGVAQNAPRVSRGIRARAKS